MQLGGGVCSLYRSYPSNGASMYASLNMYGSLYRCGFCRTGRFNVPP